MVAWDAGSTLADRFRRHAGDRRHLYGYAIRGLAEDWEAGGAVRQICAGYEDAPRGSALQLRLLAGVFRLVLAGRAPELLPYYPCLGGDRPAAEAWPVMQGVIAEHVDELREALTLAPQTNEVGRAAALLAGLFDLVAVTGVHRVRLLELGASAGLNLLLDRFHFSGQGWRWGPAGSPLQLDGAIEGVVRTEAFQVVDRRGCDLEPVDPTTEEGQRLLTSFVWPFDLHRHARLSAALDIARGERVSVDRSGAGTWLPAQLVASVAEDAAAEPVLTVVWQSITRLYWPPEEVAAVEAVLAAHGSEQRVARVSMEFDHDDGPDVSAAELRQPTLRTELWRPATATRRRLLGTAHDHGMPVRLQGAAGSGRSRITAPAR